MVGVWGFECGDLGFGIYEVVAGELGLDLRG